MKRENKKSCGLPQKVLFLLLAAVILLSGCLKNEIRLDDDPLATAETPLTATAKVVQPSTSRAGESQTTEIPSETTVPAEEPATVTTEAPQTTSASTSTQPQSQQQSQSQSVTNPPPSTTEPVTINTSNVTFPKDANGMDMPINDKMADAYRRAHQILDLQWTTLSKIPHPLDDRTIAAGTQTGMVYSSVKELEKFVPQDVSVTTFLTAIHNPYSLMYTENVSADRSASQYGFEYNGTNHCGAYYGAVCSSFAGYVFGFNAIWDTARIPFLAKSGLLEEVADNSSDGVQLMDMLYITTASGHAIHIAIVTDIIRDESGKPTRIYVSEEASPLSRTKNPETGNAYFTYEEFNTYWIKGRRKRFPDTTYPVKLYRCPALYQNDGRALSSPTANEIDAALTGIVYNDDICTYAGDYAAFSTGFPIHINYVKADYTHMVIEKENVIARIALREEYNSTHSMEITDYCQSAGKYMAYLTGKNGNSLPTHFEVIDTGISFSGNNTALTVRFRPESNPVLIEITNAPGGAKGIYELSSIERKAGVATIHPDAITMEQQGATFEKNNYVRVVFQGDYGRVVNEKTRLN